MRCSSIPGVSITDDLYLHVSLRTDGVSRQSLPVSHLPGFAKRLEMCHHRGQLICRLICCFASQDHEINMSRALGHELLQHYGLIPEPDVTRVELGPETCCLIMATDGVWDYLSPREAVRLVMEVVEGGGSAAAAAEALAEDAVQLALDSGDQADNTTAVVFVFDAYEPVSGAAGSNQSLGTEELVDRCKVSQPAEQELRDGHGHGSGNDDDDDSESDDESESSRSDVEGYRNGDD